MTQQNFTVDYGLTVAGSGGNISGATNIQASGNITAGGSIDIDGNATVGGNLFVTGNINFSGNVTQISGNSGVFYGNTSTGTGALYAGKTGFTPVANTILQVTGDLADYIQVNLQNTNHGNTASMEIALTADDGSDTDNYLDMGIASSAWDGTQTNSLGNAVAARDGYLYVQGGSTGGNLILGTTTAGYAVKFNAGGPGAANTVATVSNTGISTIGIVSATGNVRGGNINTAGIVSAAGNVVGNYVLGNAAFMTGIPASYGNANVVANLAALGSNPVSTTGNVTAGNILPISNIAFTANSSQINFNNGSYISGNTVGREGSILLQPYTGAGSTFPGVKIGGAGRIIAPNDSVSIVLNTADVTFQVPVKAITGTNSTSTTSGALQISGGGGFTGNIYLGGLISAVGDITTAANVTGNWITPNVVNITGATTLYNTATNSDTIGSNKTLGTIAIGGTAQTGQITLGQSTGTHTINISAANPGTANTKTVNIGTGQTISASNTYINLGSQYGTSNTTVYGNLIIANTLTTLSSGTVNLTGNVSGGNLLTTGLISATGTITSSGNVNSANIYVTGNITGNTGGFSIGYRDVPQIAASNVTLGLTDAGKHYYSTNSGNLTLTIPNNATIGFPIGTAISIVVQSTGNILVNAVSNVSLYLAGSSSTGNRVVGSYGMATLMKVATDTWFINGTGVS